MNKITDRERFLLKALIATTEFIDAKTTIGEAAFEKNLARGVIHETTGMTLEELRKEQTND